MKVIVKKQYENLAGFLDLGDVVELESIFSEKEIVIFSAADFMLDKKMRNEKSCTFNKDDSIVQPIGTFMGFRFKCKNGETYTNKTIVSAIGHVPISKLFKKMV